MYTAESKTIVHFVLEAVHVFLLGVLVALVTYQVEKKKDFRCKYVM